MTLKELDIRSKQYNQAVHSTKLSKEEMYKQVAGFPIQGSRVQYHWVTPRSTQPFILARSMKRVPDIYGNLVVKSKLPPRSGSSLVAVEPHP